VRAVTAGVWLLTLLYPFAIWYGMGRLEPRWLAGMLLGLALARALASRDRVWWAASAGAAVLVAAAWLANNALPLKLYPVAIAYTRKVTVVWCGFFVVTGTLALATALWSSDKTWALYNGLIAYLLMGALFAGEWLVRPRPQPADTHG
jgi:uncharacterized membrane protein